MIQLRRFESAFQIPEGTEDDSVLEALVESFDLTEGSTSSHKVVWHETFDWRLYRAGLRLTTESGPTTALVLRDAERKLLHRGPVPRRVGFTEDLSEGSLRKTLGPVLSMRTLLPLATLESKNREFQVLDRETKTVARLALRRSQARGTKGEWKRIPAILELRSVVGYDRRFHEVADFLGKVLGLQTLPGDEFSRVLDVLDRTPADYSSKVKITLDPSFQAVEATRHIHRELLQAIRVNEEGTRKDLDSEFLHDFRVAVRRTRSALSQVKNVFPAKTLDHFKREFAWLGRLTGPTRDLDVYLLKIGGYRDSLPEEVRPDLDPLRDFLVQEQRREQRKLARALNSKRYKRLLSDWQAFLDQNISPVDISDEGPPAFAERPIVDLASERIWKVYRRVMKRGLAIDDDTPAEAVHEVRIDGKKLRYLMEFFRSLYPEKEMVKSISILKRLQDNLGDFNDYEVQQASLHDFADRMARDPKTKASTLLAMGRLQARLAEGQARERQRFGERFTAFAAPEHRQRFRRLFKSA